MKKNEFIKMLEKLPDKEICCWDDNEITTIVEIAECKDKIVFGGKYGTTDQKYEVINNIDLERYKIMSKGKFLYQSEIELKKAREYDLELQRKGMLKDITTYTKMLDEYASLRGYWNWNEMIEELSRC